MTRHNQVEHSSTTDGLPVSPSLGPTLAQTEVPPHRTGLDLRTVQICGLAILLGMAAYGAAVVLMSLIAFFTNFLFHGRISIELGSADNHVLGPWVILVPVGGALVIGLMARYGAEAIRGDGIPEAMEKVLVNKSRIAPRLTILKPLSAAISIGTGGPFGAEGPIISTGGALGSFLGQLIRISAQERKVLLACGAGAGIAATFGTPIAAIFLAVEVLLFEFRPASLIPVILACTAAGAMRMLFEGAEPLFAMPAIGPASAQALVAYGLIGACVGAGSALVTRGVYAMESAFERLPVHWMWWPAIGALGVGIIGYFSPRTLGVGYGIIGDLLAGNLTLGVVALLCTLKLVSWTVALGSGTSGGTLAPLLIVGGGMATVLAHGLQVIWPQAHISVPVAALVGMAAMFTGASRALLFSVVFAFEVTLVPEVILPVLAGSAPAMLIASLLMRHSIMTMKISQRGVAAPADYSADPLERVYVEQVASRQPVCLRCNDTIARTRQFIQDNASATTHNGFPVVDENNVLCGVLTRRDLFDPKHSLEQPLRQLIRRPPVVVYHDCTLRQAADHMINHNLGRLPVVRRDDPRIIVGIITRSDILNGYRRRLEESQPEEPLPLRFARQSSSQE